MFTIPTLRTIAVIAVSGFILAACTGLERGSSGTKSVDILKKISKKKTSNRYLITNVAASVHFDTNKAILKEQDQAILAKQAEWLKYHVYARVVIEGHADERGKPLNNVALSNRRANAVLDYLVRAGVSRDRLEIIPYGASHPASLCSAERCWSISRRTVSVPHCPGGKCGLVRKSSHCYGGEHCPDVSQRQEGRPVATRR